MGVNAWSGVSKNASTQRVMYISGARATESLDCVVYTIACIRRRSRPYRRRHCIHLECHEVYTHYTVYPVQSNANKRAQVLFARISFTTSHTN